MKIKVSFNLETEEVRKLINLDPNAESLEEIIQGIIRLIPNECPEAPEIAKMSFYESVSKRIDEEFPDKCEIRDYLVDNLQERYGHMENWEDYERLKQYAILHFKKDEDPEKPEEDLADDYDTGWQEEENDYCGSEEDTAEKTTLSTEQDAFLEHYREPSNNESPEEIRNRILNNLTYKFKYAYGLTEKEIEDLVNEKQEIKISVLQRMSLEIKNHYDNVVKESIRNYWKQTTNIPVLIAEEVLYLYLLDEKTVINDEPALWEKMNAIAESLSTRISTFEFDSECDTRNEYFFEFIKNLTNGSNISDAVIERLIKQIPYSINEKYYADAIYFEYNKAQEKYIELYGKKRLAEGEKTISSLSSLPLSIDEIKTLYVWSGKGYKPYCFDIDKFEQAINSIQKNLDKRTAAGLSNHKNAIPSGACPTEPKVTDVELIEANVLMMPKLNYRENHFMIMKIFDFKNRSTIIRHLINDLKFPRNIAEELASFKA